MPEYSEMWSDTRKQHEREKKNDKTERQDHKKSYLQYVPRPPESGHDGFSGK
jgi:hypothetical protein